MDIATLNLQPLYPSKLRRQIMNFCDALYLKEYEDINIEPISRAVDCSLITEYQKSCLKQMKLLGDKIFSCVKKGG